VERRLSAQAFVLVCVVILATAGTAGAATFVVTSTGDSGAGSLRQAILDANAAPDADQIAFDIPNSWPHVITPITELPAITAPVLIDGYTQPGTSANTLALGHDAVIRIVLHGDGMPGAGLTLAGPNITVRGLSITSFATAGIALSGAAATNAAIEGNFIGLGPFGTPGPNGVGVAFGNVSGGPSHCRIGGALPSQRNVIAYNSADGVSILNDATFNAIVGNYIGVTPHGTQSAGNATGIRFHGAAGAPSSLNTIGGASPGEGNVISGNVGDGIALERALSIVVRGNIVGHAADGVSVLFTDGPDGWASRGHGISVGVDSSSDSGGHQIIGNLIRGNRLGGVRILSGTGTRLSENRIFYNQYFDIDLGGDGATPNDAADADDGPNGLQNYPVITSVVLTSFSDATVTGELTSTPNTLFRIELFSNMGGTSSGFGGGEVMAGAIDVMTDAQGIGTFSGPASIVSGNQTLTATATSPSGSTSEFSASVSSSAPAFQVGGTVTYNGVPLPGVTITPSYAPQWPLTTNVLGQYAGVVSAGTTFTVTPSLAGYTFTPASASVTDIWSPATIDFAATRPIAITGIIRDLNGTPLSGHTVTLSGGLDGSTATDAQGRYTFNGLPSGADYTVRASQSGFAFAPAVRTFATLVADVGGSAADFTAITGVFRRYFAEGATGPFFDTTLALLNPTHVPANVTLTFQKADGTTISHGLPMAPNSRATVNPETIFGLESAEFSTVAEADVPIVADRTMRWDATGYGSHAETSVTSPALIWYLAEGATIGDFNLFYLIQNPNDVAAEVSVTYLRPAPAPPLQRTYVVEPRSRFNVWVNLAAPELAAAEVSAVVEVHNDAPVIVERAMYRNGGGEPFRSGHASAGITKPATTWFLAEGNTGPYFDLFVLISNPTSTDAHVTATYLLPGGETVTKQYVVPAQSRFNIWVDEEELPAASGNKALADTAVSTTIMSTNDVPLIVERSMWWPGNATTWLEGHNSPGATATGTAWAFADGEVGGPSGTNTYILIANSNMGSADARVTLFFEDGTTAVETFNVSPTSRSNVDVGLMFPAAYGRRFGALVESVGDNAFPIVVERAMYSDAKGVRWAAGTAIIGTRLR
jgi:hypothetical protein